MIKLKRITPFVFGLIFCFCVLQVIASILYNDFAVIWLADCFIFGYLWYSATDNFNK